MVEQWPEEPRVVSSILTLGTKKNSNKNQAAGISFLDKTKSKTINLKLVQSSTINLIVTFFNSIQSLLEAETLCREIVFLCF